MDIEADSQGLTDMRIPDDVEELVLAFMDIDKKKGLMGISRENLDVLVMSEIECALKPGFIEKNDDPTAFSYRVTKRGKEILQILSPCKRSGR
jgi:hypothetical protein